MSQASHQVYDITPDQRTLRVLGATGEPAHKAIAELIDNAIDARLPGARLSVEVTVKVRGAQVTSIEVEDDGSGMTSGTLAKALMLGASDKEDGELGKFGFGLKTAVSSLGTRWAITTATPRCERAAQVRSQDIAGWKAAIGGVPKLAEHGTSILIQGCERLHAPTLMRDLTEGLGELYAHFIHAKDLSLYLNGEPVKLPELELMDGSKRVIDFYVGKRRVTGWVGVRRFASPRFGLNLVRNRRVIETMVKLGFPADGNFARVVGEIHLDEFPVDNHKARFVKTGTDWQLLGKELLTHLKPTLEASRQAVASDRKKVNPELVKMLAIHTGKLVTAVQGLDGADFLARSLRVVKPRGPRTVKEAGTPPPAPFTLQVEEVDTTPRPAKPPKAAAPELDIPVLVDLPIHHQFVAGGPTGPARSWSKTERVGGEDALVIQINTDHPAYVDGIQYPVVMRHTIEAMAQYLALEAAHALGQPEPGLVRYEAVLDRVRRVASDALIPVW